MASQTEWSISVDINLTDSAGYNRFGLNERAQLQGMTFEKISQLLKAFHIITEAIKEERQITVNGQEIRT